MVSDIQGETGKAESIHMWTLGGPRASMCLFFFPAYGPGTVPDTYLIGTHYILVTVINSMAC